MFSTSRSVSATNSSVISSNSRVSSTVVWMSLGPGEMAQSPRNRKASKFSIPIWVKAGTTAVDSLSTGDRSGEIGAVKMSARPVVIVSASAVNRLVIGSVGVPSPVVAVPTSPARITGG